MSDKTSDQTPASSPSQHNGRITGAVPKVSSTSHQNGSLAPVSGLSTPSTASTTPLRTFRTLGGLLSHRPRSSSESPGSSKPVDQNLESEPRLRTRTNYKLKDSQQMEAENLLDLILDSQCQRMEDQRASHSLLPEPTTDALCGACTPDLDFYYMLIRYQSDRMEDQRCSLPDLDDVVNPVPEGQEDFFSLIQRVQSRRMDEQRASLLETHPEEDRKMELTDSSHNHYHIHH